MKVILSVFFSFFLFSAHAQEKALFSVDYLVKYMTSAEGSVKTDEMRLDVGRSLSHFYSLYALENKLLTDSFTRANRLKELPQAMEDRGTTTAQTYEVFKNFPLGHITYIDKVIKETYNVITLQEKINWQLEDRDSVIMGYPCSMATTDYLGRKWTAWYSKNISVPDGPWKLYGLPGLIIFAEDSTHIFSFCCIGINKSSDVLVTIPEGDFKSATMRQLNHLYRTKVENPITFLKSSVPEGLAAKILENEAVKKMFSRKHTAVLLENQ